MQLYEVERGQLVAYIPAHAQGDICHRDVKQGRVKEVCGEVVIVDFGNTTQGCFAEQLVSLEI